LSSEPLASPEIQCRVSWPRLVTETRRLSWGHPVSQGLASHDVSAPIGLARIPSAVVLNVEALARLPQTGSGAFPPLPSPVANQSAGRSPHRLRIPSRVLPTPHRRNRAARCTGQRPETPNSRLLLPRFLPLQRLLATGSHIPPTRSHLAGYVASSGFRTLATLCSPHGLPGLFHPGPAHGVYPPRP